MPIPESQLETWAHQGAVAQSRDTYASIRRALEDSSARHSGKDYTIFLQGSYANDTNVYAESDVDVVIRLSSTYFHEFDSDTPADQRAVFDQAWTPATYLYDQYRSDVIAALRRAFGSAVTVGNKAITVAAAGNRRKADVIPAALFRQLYAAPRPAYSYLAPHPLFHEGICFYTAGGQRIVNYPGQHSANCTAKHQATTTWFKPVVRILKNWRNVLVDRGVLPSGVAPSYFVEGMLYNVPASCFGGSYGNTVVRCLEWLQNANRDQLLCANERYYLVRDGVHNCWATANYEMFRSTLTLTWNSWQG